MKNKNEIICQIDEINFDNYEQIGKSQFEIKLNYLKKLVKERKNIGIELIEILGNDGYINEIHMLAEKALKKTLMSYSGTMVYEPETIFISLVLIAMLHYEEGRYYESVRITYKSLYDVYSAQKIEGTIRGILSRYSLKNGNRERNINAALYNAIVPAYYLPAFFDFIYDIYKLNFDFDLPEDLYEEFMFVYEGLKQSMLSDGDDVQVNVTRKSYKLIKTTKRLIANEECIESIIKLSIIAVHLIDKKVWDEEIEIFNPYLKNGFENWTLSFSNFFVSKERKRTQSELRSRWEPKFITLNNEVYLVPPIHRVKAIYDYRTIRIEVENNGKKIYVNQSPDIREIIGGYQISVGTIRIDNPLGMVTYKLLAGDEILYSSKEKLHRKVLAFSIDGNEIKNNTDFSGTAIFCYASHCDKLKKFFETANYMLASYCAHIGDAIFFDGTIFNFSKLARPGVFGTEHENHFIMDKCTNQKYPVFKEVKYVVFESKNIESNFEINIDGHAHKIQNLQCNKINREGVVKYIINLMELDSGLHIISVYELLQGRRNVLSTFTFAIDKQLVVEIEECSDTDYIVSIDSELLDSNIVTEITPSTYSIYGIKLNFEQRELFYMIPFELKYFEYRDDKENWRAYKECIWIGDITPDTILRICDNSVTDLRVYDSDGRQIEEDIKLSSREYAKEVKIGFLNSYKNTNSHLILVFMKDGIKKGATVCYTRCELSNETSVEYDMLNKTLVIDPVFYGKGNIYFTITDSEGNQIYKSSYIENREIVLVNGLRAFKMYSITFFEKKKGLSLQGDQQLGLYKTTIYDWDEMVGKSFKIVEVYYDQLVRGEFLRKHHYFNRSYIRIVNRSTDGSYEGELYTSTSKGNYDLFRINPIYVEICGDAIDGTVELSITKEGDGLLLDFEHHAIMNTLDDPNAVDIFSYIIDLKGIEFE